MALGTKIRQARHKAGMTQAALARAAGVSERNVVRWENDQHAPRFEHVAAIADATGNDVAFFLEDEEGVPRSMAHTDDLSAVLTALIDERIREAVRSKVPV